jgi:hypothetical protein
VRWSLLLLLVAIPRLAFAEPKVAVAPLDDDDGKIAEIVSDVVGERAKVTKPGRVEGAMRSMGVSVLSTKSLKKLRAKLDVDVVIFGSVEKDGGAKRLSLTFAGSSKTKPKLELDIKTPKQLRKDLAGKVGKRIAAAMEGDGGDEDDEEEAAQREEERKRDEDRKREDERKRKEEEERKREEELRAERKRRDDEERKREDDERRRKNRRDDDDERSDDDDGRKRRRDDDDERADRKKRGDDDDRKKRGDVDDRKRRGDDDERSADRKKRGDDNDRKRRGDDDDRKRRGDDDDRKRRGDDDDGDSKRRKNDDDDGKRVADEDDDGGSARKRLDDDEDEDEDGERPRRKKRRGRRHVLTQTALWLDGGAAVARRTLTYASTGMMRPPPVGVAAASGRLEGEVYPAAFSTLQGPAAGLGINAVMGYTVGLGIAVPNTTVTAPVKNAQFAIGARYRFVFGAHSVAAGVSYWRRYFLADRSGLMNPDQLDMPDVDYKAIAPGVAARIGVTPKIAAFGTLDIPLMLNSGPIQEPKSYGSAKILAFDFRGGAQIMVANHAALQISAEFMQVGLAFTGQAGSKASARMVQSATDRSIGLSATVGITY